MARPDFEDFRFVFDAKLTGKLAKGEKYLNDVLLPALGSSRGRPDRELIAIIEWQNPPVHQFERNFGTSEGTLDLRKLFAHGLEFGSSHDHAGLRLADVVAYTARRRIVNPAVEAADRAWRTIRPVLRTLEGEGLHILRFASAGGDADLSRYIGM